MFKFILKLSVRAFALIGLLVVLAVAGGVWLASSKVRHAEKPPEKIVLVINFRDELTEKSEAMPNSLRQIFDVVSREDGQTVLHDVVQALQRGAADPRVVGVVGLFSANLPNLTQSQEIRAALEKFRAGGKFSTAFSPSYGDFGPGNKAYYMASAFEQVWLQPVGTLGVSGLRLENPFGRNVLDKIGVKAAFIQREEYKTAMSFLTDDKMSAPMREEMQTILDSLNEQMVGGIAAGRKLPPEQVKALLGGGPYTAQEALDRKLIDKIGYSDEIEQWLDEKHGKNVAKMHPADYLALPPADHAKPDAHPKGTVALIIAEGEIADAGGRPSPLTGGGASMDAREIAEAFDDAAADKAVQLIVFRVDSPGGSPTASETIRRAVIKAQEKGKKVIVSMGQMAGSGGYWVAMNADRIFANPATLTGSIGVLGGKLDLSGLYEKIGLNWEVLQTGQYSGLWSLTHGYTPEEKARMDVLLDDTYHTFRDNVAKARKIPPEKLPFVSKGRVFTGEQALKLGLVDELGGLRTALDYAKTSLNLKPEDRVALKLFPKPMTPSQRVRDVLKLLFSSQAALPSLSAVTLPALQQWAHQLVPLFAARMPVMIVQ